MRTRDSSYLACSFGPIEEPPGARAFLLSLSSHLSGRWCVLRDLDFPRKGVCVWQGPPVCSYVHVLPLLWFGCAFRDVLLS